MVPTCLNPPQQHQAFLPCWQWGSVRCGPGYHFLNWVQFLHLLRLPGLQNLFTHVGLLSLSVHRMCSRGFVDHTVFLLQGWGVSCDSVKLKSRDLYRELAPWLDHRFYFC